jgi:excinuclease UvrABC nuclease subunit
MTVKETSLTVQTPIPQKHLSRFRNKTGIYLIRRNEKVLFIGSAKDIYKAVMRHFQKGGALSELNRNRLSFEIIESNLLFRNIETVLKRHYTPKFNKRIKPKGNLSNYEKRHFKRILEAYLNQTRFEVQAEHKTDLNNP